MDWSLLIWAAGIVGLFVILASIIVRLYIRATPDMAVVRTGLGGLQVITSGGTLVVPVIHEYKRVNLKVIRLDITREHADALITKDLMRANCVAAFYVKVKNTAEAIAAAATTIGQATLDNSEALKKLVEGKLVDALRSAGAQMDMEELHRKRDHFSQQVQQAVSIELSKNGLELESVSLTTLDNSPIVEDKGNFFNAVGGLKQAEIIAEQRKKKAAVTADADVEVALKEGDASKKKADIRLEVENKNAATAASIAKRQQEAEAESETAEVNRKKSVAVAQAVALADQRIAEVDNQKKSEVADADKRIAIAEKSEALSAAQGKAALAKADSVKAEQAIITVQEVAIAERAKSIAIVQAQQAAEVGATELRVRATAEKDAATDRAEAARELAQGEADAAITKANATKATMLAEAEVKTALINADNSVSSEVMEFRLQTERVKVAPGVFASLLEPLKNLEGVRVNIISGNLGGNGNGISGGNGGEGNDVARSFIDKISDAFVSMPIAVALGKQIGVDMSEGMTGAVQRVVTQAFDPKAAQTVKNIDGNDIDAAPATRPINEFVRPAGGAPAPKRPVGKGSEI